MPIRKKKAGREVETAGMMRWLLTYADMITLLLAMFILLYAVSKVNLEKYKKFTEAAADAFGGRKAVPKAGTASSATGLSGLEENLQSAYNTIKGIIDKEKLQDKVQIDVEERGIRLSFMTDGVFFDIGKAELKPGFEKILSSIAPILMQITNFIRIEGHTCNMPIDTPEFPSNWELSSRRATNVLRFLLEKGLPGIKMSAAGYAETRPIVPNNSDKNRVRNRRVDIIILKTSEGKLEPKSPVVHVIVKPGTWLSIMEKAKATADKKKKAEEKEAVKGGPEVTPKPVVEKAVPVAPASEAETKPAVETQPIIVPVAPAAAKPELAPAAVPQVLPAIEVAAPMPIVQEQVSVVAAVVAPKVLAPSATVAPTKKQAISKTVAPVYRKPAVKTTATAAKPKIRSTTVKPASAAVKATKAAVSTSAGSVYFPSNPEKSTSGN